MTHAGSLDGYVVVDLTRALAGPHAGMRHTGDVVRPRRSGVQQALAAQKRHTAVIAST